MVVLMRSVVSFFNATTALILLLMPMFAIAQQTVQVSTFNSPFSTVMKEVILEAYKRAEVSVQVTHYPGSRALKMSSTGAADAELYRIEAINEIYPDLVRIPVPLYLFEVRAFSKNFDFKPDGWKSLQNYKVGVLQGVKVTEQNTEGLQRESVNNLQHMFTLLESGRIDLAITTKVAGNITMNQLNLQHIKMLNPPVYSFPVFHFIHKSNSQLVSKITETLTQMRNEGVIDQIIATQLKEIYNSIEAKSSP